MLQVETRPDAPTPPPGDAVAYGFLRECPEGCGEVDRVLFVLQHLHDAHGWERTRLITWTCRVERGEA